MHYSYNIENVTRALVHHKSVGTIKDYATSGAQTRPGIRYTIALTGDEVHYDLTLRDTYWLVVGLAAAQRVGSPAH
jgi:hypothetical protein